MQNGILCEMRFYDIRFFILFPPAVGPASSSATFAIV